MDGKKKDTTTTTTTTAAAAGSGEADPSEYVTTLLTLDTIPEGIVKSMQTEEEESRTGMYLFRISHFSKINKIAKFYTPTFSCAGANWRVLFVGQRMHPCVSMYLDCVMSPEEGEKGIPAQIALFICREPAEDPEEMDTDTRTLIEDDITDPRKLVANVKIATPHRYNTADRDWGFDKFISREDITSKIAGRRYIIDDTLVFGVAVKIMKDELGILWHNFLNYDSKKQTGYVGLKNQGATCYMNSILQAYYFTGKFRKVVFQIPVEGDNIDRNIPFALQRVFYHLMTSTTPVGTIELTKSFGWDTMDSFMQHDVQEFNRVLCDNLETKMKGSVVDGEISKLLAGKMKSFIKCINVEFESSRTETFYDIQLNVKGMKTLEESFENYVEMETLDGDNKYQSEKFGLQDAKKGVIFENFPPLLHLQLKRFEYDFDRNANVKIHDRFEFPDMIDLTRFMENPETRTPQIFHLHGVLVHSGDSHGGHYCVFIKTKPRGKWYKFDDDRVTPCFPKEALDENFGQDTSKLTMGMKPISRFSRLYTSAYMLVYVREDALDSMMCDVTIDDVPQHLRDNFDRERQAAEQENRLKNDEHNFMPVYLLSDLILGQHRGPGLFQEEESAEDGKAQVLKIRKDMMFKEFSEYVAEKLQTPHDQIRFWTVVQRGNRELRIDKIVSGEEASSRSMNLIRSQVGLRGDLILYAEYARSITEPYFPPWDHNSILLFFKYYDPSIGQLRHIGSIITKTSKRLLDLAPQISSLLDLPESTSYVFYEELSQKSVEKLNQKDSLGKSKLILSGDVICVQKESTAQEDEKHELPTLEKYFQYEVEKMVVHFRSRLHPKDLSAEIILTLSKKTPYDTVAAKLGEKLNHDPQKLRFTRHSTSYQDGAPSSEIKYRSDDTLQDMLHITTYQPLSHILYYEKLDMTIKEMEKRQFFSVHFITPTMQLEGPFEVLVPRDGKVEDLLREVREKLLASRNEKKKQQQHPQTAEKPAEAESEKEKEKEKEEKEDSSTDAMDTSPDLSAEEVAPPLNRLRAISISHHKIEGCYLRDVPLVETDTYNVKNDDHLYVEEIPKEELEKSKDDKIVKVVHYQKDAMYTHGVPFFFVLKKGEKKKDTLARLQKRANVSDKEWAKYKFSTLVHFTQKAIDTDDEEESLYDLDWNSISFLGLDHVDKTPKTGRFGVERAVVIRN